MNKVLKKEYDTIVRIKNTILNMPLEKVIRWIFAFLMILSIHSVISEASSSRIQSNFNKLIILVSFILLVYCVKTFYNEKINIRNLIILELYYACTVYILYIAQFINGVFTYNNSWVKVAWFGLLIIPVMYLQFIKNDLWIFTYFRKIMIVLSAISLFFWVLSILNVPTNTTTTISWGGFKILDGYFGIHYLAQGPVHFLGIETVRNTGIFTEAPMFSAALSIAFLIHLFIDNKRIDKVTILFVITIISTTSTTGLIIVLGSISLILIKKYLKVSKYLLIGLILVVAVVVYFIFQSKMKNMSASYNIRLDDLYAGFKTWLRHPWFGNGLGNNAVIKQNMSPERLMYSWSNSGFSSGIFSVLVQGGVYQFIVLLGVPLVAFARKNSSNLFFVILVVAILFVSIINDTFIFILLLIFMMISGFGKVKYQ